jgi:hypothetical protein
VRERERERESKVLNDSTLDKEHGGTAEKNKNKKTGNE